MLPITEQQIRNSFINASLRERKSLTLPENFDELDWANMDFLGWRDEKLPLVGYVVTFLADEPVGIMFRKAEGKNRNRPQCSWCEDVNLPNDVTFFNAKQAGPAGRNGDTISTLVCEKFECSANVRTPQSLPYIGFDREAAIAHRIKVLQDHVQNFAQRVRDGEK
ncbi:FBP domain-containing protein [Paeniglutamicibacter sp. R2-26]|uniref:FBP domain-containing protein n=1 Tax=Paeniglutamicibacter sp. R2-26 TaxID=3144417 RepID=UPI003EE77806